MNQDDMPEFDRNIGNNALRVYGDAMDDFPVLKAFQQYIDAEQAKARKRLLSLGIFFGILTGAIIAVFVLMLMNVTTRNQELNDRLVEYAMKDRDRLQSPVVVQPPQDNSAMAALTAKLDELQRKIDESRAKAEKDAAVAAERARIAAMEAAKPKGPSPEELEIKRLNALLAAEREKAAEKARLDKERAAAEKERKRQEELEAYRRKYYPELYGLPKTLPQKHRLALPPTRPGSTPDAAGNKAMIDDDDDDLPDDDSAIDYFDDADDEPALAKPNRRRAASGSVNGGASGKKPQPPSLSAAASKAAPAEPEAKPATDKARQSAPEEKGYEIPVEVRGKNSNFRIPF